MRKRRLASQLPFKMYVKSPAHVPTRQATVIKMHTVHVVGRDQLLHEKRHDKMCNV